ncbi:NADP-dependent phosphogluconate dehydrogenase [Pararhodobacter oceanensis]|uniref:NADP-dependent phosphogluconate dehydrogenase n=1 Tax=Pararhodobacter oceanensis TaxID=2172121 RepID=UPI003A8E36FA
MRDPAIGHSDIGLIGLGTMGAMLALNIAERGFAISVYNRTAAVTDAFVAEAGDLAARITPAKDFAALVQSIARPRKIILMVPAGPVVDLQIAELTPFLEDGDIIVDAGNANFHDTERRAAEVQGFIGIGVSGGAEGARHGPSIMGGGALKAWTLVAPVLEAIAARYDGQPCASWMGPGGAGHFVKTVHNGIEYADMQLIAEAYGVMRDGMGMPSAGIAPVFEGWNAGRLRSYLIEISAQIAAANDAESGAPMLDVILDRAGQKGTGRWTAIEAQHLGAPIPVIEAAVAARNISAALEVRHAGQALFEASPKPLPEGALTLEDLESALIAGKITCYAQGFGLLDAASAAFGWGLTMPAIAEVWRAGCIIRSAMLDDMAAALRDAPARNLMQAPVFAGLLRTHEAGLRKTASVALTHGLPVPALTAALAYFDMMRTARGTANMIQAQRDFFGEHGFERLDRAGSGFHGDWG